MGASIDRGDRRACAIGRGARRSLPAAVRVVLGAALVFATVPTSPAWALDPKIEDAAKKADQQAMDFDFLSLDLKKAKKRLQDALKKCGKGKCSDGTLAALHRDLGIVLINAKDAKGGTKELAAAIALDPAITVGKDYLDNPEVKKAYESVRKTSGGGGGSTGGGTTGGGGGESAGGGDEPTETASDIPTAEGNVVVKTKLAPTGSELPLLIEVPKGVDVAKVKVSYKSASMDKYKVLEAKKVKSKYLVILDCAATAKAGTIKYFVRAYDADAVELEHYGTPKHPALLKIAESVSDEERPLLPGDEEPKSCEEGAAGEAGDGGKKPEGSGCDADEECDKGLACVENVESGKKQCKAEESAKSGAKVDHAWWVGVDGEIDVLFLSADHNICNAPSWTCSADSVPGKAGRSDVGNVSEGPTAVRLSTDPQSGGKTDGGSSVGTKRAFVSLDYFVAPRFSVGGRLGYAFGGNPTDVAKFNPLHFEVRAQYFFATGLLRPFALVGGGFGRMEGPVPDVIVTPNDANDASDTVTCAGGTCPVIKGVKAYKLGGPLFAAVGLGTWVMVGERAAIDLAFKLDFTAPTFVIVVAPEIGFKVGF